MTVSTAYRRELFENRKGQQVPEKRVRGTWRELPATAGAAAGKENCLRDQLQETPTPRTASGTSLLLHVEHVARIEEHLLRHQRLRRTGRPSFNAYIKRLKALDVAAQ